MIAVVLALVIVSGLVGAIIGMRAPRSSFMNRNNPSFMNRNNASIAGKRYPAVMNRNSSTFANWNKPAFMNRNSSAFNYKNLPSFMNRQDITIVNHSNPMWNHHTFMNGNRPTSVRGHPFFMNWHHHMSMHKHHHYSTGW
jgi:hypothetical protein